MDWFGLADIILSGLTVFFIVAMIKYLREINRTLRTRSPSKICPKCGRPIEDHTLKELEECGLMKEKTQGLKKAIFK